MPPYFVYVLHNEAGRLYIGSTVDLESRVAQHQAGEAGWTRTRGPWELVHHEEFDTLAEAVRRERSLKRGANNQALRDRFR
jgi:putative endonuclease